MVATDRGQLLLLGGLAMAIVFLAAIPLSNSLVVTESAASSETAREIDRTADRQANIERDIRTLANRTDAVNNTDAFNASLRNYSLYRTQVSGQRSGVYVNASLNVTASQGSELSQSSGQFTDPDGCSNPCNWTLAREMSHIGTFNISITGGAAATPASNGPFLINVSESAGSDSWLLIYDNPPSGQTQLRVVAPSGSTTTHPVTDDATVNIAAGTYNNETGPDQSPSPLASNYTAVDSPYAVSFNNTRPNPPQGSYYLTGYGEFDDSASPGPLIVPHVDIVYNGPDVSYERTIGVDESS